MRNRLSLYTLILCILCPLANFAQVDLNKGLMAYYPFNGNANDESGNGNNPVFNNATLAVDYYGNSNSAYYFNGIDNYIEIPNSSTLNTGNQISICAWIKPMGFYYGQCHGNSVLMKGNSDFQTGNYMLRFDDALYTGTNCDGGKPDTLHQTYYGIGTGLSPVQDTPYAQKNIWRSVVYTYDGQHARLYIDCKLILDSEVSGLTFNNGDNLLFGKLNSSQFPYWLNAMLDEVRVYNRVLNLDEVKAYSFSCADEQPCSNWGEINQGVSGFEIGDLDVKGNKITIEALISRATPFPPLYNGGDIVSKHDNPGDANYLLRPTLAQITTSNGFFETNPACDIELNKTYHIAMVYDGKKIKFYRNGFLMSEVNASGNLYQNDWVTKIGTTANVASPYPADFIGYINEVRIWNVARSQNEIKSYMYQPLPNPASQAGLLAYYTFDDLKNKQGNGQWDATILGNAKINEKNPTCAFVADSCDEITSNVTPSFVAPDSICVNTPVDFKNTSVGATNYYWSFCAAEFNTMPQADNLGNPKSLLERPVFMDYILDDDGNYYGFVSNHDAGHIIKLNYGNSLLNAPTATDLGNFNGIIPAYTEGIQVAKSNGKCYLFVVTGGNLQGSNSALVRLDFGNSFSNNPVANNLGNVGSLSYPHDLFITAENGNFYGFTININNSTITRFDFGNDLANTPSGINLGSIGSFSYPCGFSFVNTNGNWYAFVTNRDNNTISRLNFGNSLTNIPTGANIGNPGGYLRRPRDISLFQSCNSVVGLVVNEENEQTGTIIRFDFGNDLLSMPQATDLGNLGGLQFPHSISKFFLEENDIYSFVTNVTNSTITRLRYKGCTTTNIPSSTQFTPPSVSYSEPGVYNVNLLVDVGLPTQTSFCKQIIVEDCDNTCDSFKVSAGNDTSICYGDSVQLNATGAINYIWNSSTALSDTTINSPVVYPADTQLFIVKGYNDSGCFATDTIKITVLPLPAFTTTKDTAICVGDSVQLEAKGVGSISYNWMPSAGLSNINANNPVASPSITTKYYVTVTNAKGCISADSVIVNVLNLPKVTTINDTSICKGEAISLNTNVSDADIIKWLPSIGLNNGNVQNPIASPSTSTLYVVTTGNGICSTEDSVFITVLSLPGITVSNDTTLCGNASVPLNASGADSYTWSPQVGLSNPSIPNPVVSPSVTTTYYVTGISSNSCSKTDSVIITKQPDPIFSLTSSTTSVCAGDSVLLTASGGDIYNWRPAATILNPSIGTTPVFPSVNTTYEVIIINSICKVNDTLSADIIVKEAPVITVSKSNDIDCINYEAQLTASGGINYKWSPAIYISNTNVYNPVVNPRADTWYFVEAKGSNGCRVEDSIFVKSNYNPEDAKFEIATAFTPNYDGLNDCFSVRYWGPADFFDMSIYNRWGQLVFHSNNINACWDGKFKGLEQAPGVYVYNISISSNCTDGLVHKKGTFVLIR